jgi:polyhydroxyalkanoate synthase subunit PhaC
VSGPGPVHHHISSALAGFVAVREAIQKRERLALVAGTPPDGCNLVPGSSTGIRPSSPGNPDLVSGPGNAAVRSMITPAVTTLHAADRLRRQQGWMLDLLGLGPQQLPARLLLAGRTFRVCTYPAVAADAPPLLLVAAPIKRAYIWDLVPHASTVRLLVRAGFTVHLLEWLDPQPPDADLGLEAYADLLLGQAVEAVTQDCSRAPLLVGHSLGGTLAALFCALHPDRVRGVVLLEAPLHFGADAGAFAPLVAASPDLRRVHVVPGLVPGSLLDLATVAAAPREFLLERQLDLLATLGQPVSEVHLRVLRWTLDEMALPARLFTEIVEDLYRDDRFLRGQLPIAGRRLGPESMTVPMSTVVGPRSTAVPPSSIVPFHHRAASTRKLLLEYHGDRGVALQHVGVLVGRRAHDSLWPQLVDWLHALP